MLLVFLGGLQTCSAGLERVDEGMIKMRGISRQLLRDQVREALVSSLVSGELEPGTQIVEAELAGEMGVSRTPLKEALLQLETEGLLHYEVGRGFSVMPLDVHEIENLLQVGVVLEELAVRLTESFSAEHVARLRTLNEQRKAHIDERFASADVDQEWHRCLVEACENPQLLDILEIVRTRLYRYAYAYAGNVESLKEGIAGHSAILDALERDDMSAALVLIRTHWEEGIREMKRTMAETG